MRTVKGNEVVYVRRSRTNPFVFIKVYTSIRVGQAAARSRGQDSIKVCTVFETRARSFGIGRFPRVHRTGSVEAVLARIQGRIMQAAARGNEWIRENEGPDTDTAQLAWLERIADKRAVADRERRQEERAFRSGP